MFAASTVIDDSRRLIKSTMAKLPALVSKADALDKQIAILEEITTP